MLGGCGASLSAAEGARTRGTVPSGLTVVRHETLGHSVRGRAISAWELGAPAAPARVLVVGDIHGNEPAGIAVALALEQAAPRATLDLWVIDDLNPDGVAAHTRQNAHGVDLNRNFPYAWHAAGVRGDQQYPGPRPLSEPESRAAHALILRIRPAITIWFHQPLGVVDESGGDIAVERRFARASGLPLRRLTRYPGSAAGWQNHALAGSTAFVVELPAGPLSARSVARLRDAVFTTPARRSSVRRRSRSRARRAGRPRTARSAS